MQEFYIIKKFLLPIKRLKKTNNCNFNLTISPFTIIYT